MKYSRYFASWILLALVGLFFTMPNSNAQGQSAGASFTERAQLFTYDTTANFNLKEQGVEKRGNVSVHDISFVGALGGDPIKAYLVVPDGAGPFAGVLWLHWLGEHNSDRNEFLDEAVGLAAKGTVSLLIDTMWAAPGWYGKRILEQDYDNSIRQVINSRRAMDLLLSQPNIDKTRIGQVGHDYGGMYGAIAAGLDQRAKTYVFIAVTPSLSNWAFFATQPKSKVDYIRQNAVFELTDYLAQIKNASTLGQFSNADPYISRTDSFVFMSAAPKPSERKFYDAGHDMAGATILADRNAWLSKELNLK